MFNIYEPHYIFKLSSGKTLNIFYKDGTGICSSILNKKNFWLPPEVIIRTAKSNFSACMDSLDNIHILCQNRRGDLIYLRNKNKAWNSEPVLTSKSPSSYDKNVHIECFKDDVFLFYILEYSEKKLLSFQVKKRTGELADPRVIDYVPGDKTAYKVIRDTADNFYAFYSRKDEEQERIGCKRYIESRGLWGDFVPVTAGGQENKLLSVSPDHSNTLHLCWQRASGNDCQLVYSKKPSNTEEWNEQKVVLTSDYRYNSSDMIVIEGRVIIYWLKDNSILYCTGTDGGRTWSKARQYTFSHSQALHCLKYSSNLESGYKSLCSGYLPGSYTGGYKLAFIDDRLAGTDAQAAPNPNEAGTNNLVQISESINELKAQINQISDRVESIAAKQQQVEIEIDKVHIKSSITDTEISEIESHIEALKNYIHPSDANIPPAHHAPVPEQPEDDVSKPIMPGTGFAHITPEYLKSIKK